MHRSPFSVRFLLFFPLRLCAFAGALLVSLGFFLASMTTSLLFLYIVFGVIVGAGRFVAVGMNMQDRFPILRKADQMGERAHQRLKGRASLAVGFGDLQQRVAALPNRIRRSIPANPELAIVVL